MRLRRTCRIPPREMTEMAEALEAIMLICFGLSWPMNAYKNFKARTAAGTSWQFILLITLGYFRRHRREVRVRHHQLGACRVLPQRRLHRRQLGRVLPQLAPSTVNAIDCAKRRTRRMPWRKRMPRDNGAVARACVVVSSIPCVRRGRWPISIYMQLISESRLERGFPRIPANRHPDLPTS